MVKVYWWCFHGHGAVHRELKRKRDILYVHLLSIMMYSYYRLGVSADNVVGTVSAGHWFITVFFHCMSTLIYWNGYICVYHAPSKSILMFVSVCMLFAIIAETFEVVSKHTALNLHLHIKLCESMEKCRETYSLANCFEAEKFCPCKL